MAMMRERWVIAKELALEIAPGQRPQLGYAVLAGLRTFPTEEIALIALNGLRRVLATSEPSGWVIMRASQLLPDLYADPCDDAE